MRLRQLGVGPLEPAYAATRVWDCSSAKIELTKPGMRKVKGVVIY